MIRINQLKLHIGYKPEDVTAAAAGKLRVRKDQIRSLRIVKRSLDARDKADIHYSITADVSVPDEGALLKRFSKQKNISKAPVEKYILPGQGTEKMSGRPYVIGSGPAGLFCAYMLAVNGYRPVLIEQGEDVRSRRETVKAFHEGKVPVDPLSNVQFGEGGAGTFSDGKLNCSVKDRQFRSLVVLDTFIKFGGDEEIRYESKPHVGTDKLSGIVEGMRDEIIRQGGEVRFNTKLTGITLRDAAPQKGARRITGVTFSERGGRDYTEPCSILVLATGHSSRDTFYMLKQAGLKMEPKPFAVGVRAEHLQEKINEAQYGKDYRSRYGKLPAADYKLTYHTKAGRSVYSFCMCPGGYVIDSSSEEGCLCVNGMSYSGRSGENANAAIIVNVTPEDTGAAEGDVMKGVEFQRTLEQVAYSAGGGKIPVQRLGDFKGIPREMHVETDRLRNADSAGSGQAETITADILPQHNGMSLPDEEGNRKITVNPAHKGRSACADINEILPDFVSESIKEAFPEFGKRIKGFDDPDTLLSAVESRTSSPVRITRDDTLQSNIRGIYPCGEGAGYAGGIMSAAMDGIKVFEEIYKTYRG